MKPSQIKREIQIHSLIQEWHNVSVMVSGIRLPTNVVVLKTSMPCTQLYKRTKWVNPSPAEKYSKISSFKIFSKFIFTLVFIKIEVTTMYKISSGLKR